MKTTVTDINTYLVVALIIAVGFGLYFTLSVPTPKPYVPPPLPEVQVMLLGKDCEGCFNGTEAVNFLKAQQNLNVTDVKEFTLEESQQHATKYGIERLPAVVVTGNITGLTLQNFEAKNDALVFAKVPPPYYDIASKSIKGKVTVIVLQDNTCDKCFNISQISNQLTQLGINMASEKTVEAKSSEGKELISKYKIEKVPTLIFNKEALEYDVIKQVWSQVGSEESDSNLVLRIISPPYLNVSTGKIDGIVEITYLSDKTCSECYNASMVKDLLKQSFTMEFGTEKEVDIADTKGKSLLEKYKIELVPTVILSADAAAYPTLGQAWPQAGTIEKDGTFVFRSLQLLEGQIYKNITSGELLGKQEEAEITAPEAEQ